MHINTNIILNVIIAMIVYDFNKYAIVSTYNKISKTLDDLLIRIKKEG
jgi:hypothetical protein